MSSTLEELLARPENQKKSEGLSNKGMFLLGTAGAVFVGMYAITGPFLAPALRKICLPFVPATAEQVKNVFSLLGKAKTTPGNPAKDTLLDIGSGDGRIVIEAAKQGYKATGVELNRWLVYWSRLSALRAGVSSNTTFIKRDLWKFDMSSYDNVVIFGVEEMMEPLKNKIEKESKAGTTIIACRNEFSGWKADAETGEGVDSTWKYTRL